MSTPMAFDRAVTIWLRSLEAERKSQRTTEHYRQIIGVAFRAYLERQRLPLTLASITANTAREWTIWLRAEHAPTRPRSQNTVRHYLGVLKGFVHWLMWEGYLKADPLKTVRLPRQAPIPVETLSMAQVQALLYQAHHRQHHRRDVALLLVLLDTGLRVAELCALTVEDVDLSGHDGYGVVHVRHGKGDRAREVFINPRAIKALEAYLAERAHGKAGAGRARTPQLFLLRDGAPMLTYSVRTLLYRLGRRAGVAGVHPHLFRHTFATMLTANGAEAFALQKLLGHTHIETTMRYVHLAKADLARVHSAASPVEVWELGRRFRQPDAKGGPDAA